MWVTWASVLSWSCMTSLAFYYPPTHTPSSLPPAPAPHLLSPIGLPGTFTDTSLLHSWSPPLSPSLTHSLTHWCRPQDLMQPSSTNTRTYCYSIFTTGSRFSAYTFHSFQISETELESGVCKDPWDTFQATKSLDPSLNFTFLTLACLANKANPQGQSWSTAGPGKEKERQARRLKLDLTCDTGYLLQNLQQLKKDVSQNLGHFHQKQVGACWYVECFMVT